MAVLQSPSDQKLLHDMKVTEEEHLAGMERLIRERRVRPTALLPLWHVAGYALGMYMLNKVYSHRLTGAGTALLGREAAMACTVAVETAIGEHYNDQIRELIKRGYDEDELKAILKKNRDEELDHLNTGLEQNAEKAPLYGLLSNAIQTGCKLAIWITKSV